MNSFFSKMNQRERILASVVGGALVLILCMALVRYVMNKQTVLRAQIATKQTELNSLGLLAGERGMWAERDQWIDTAQPTLANPSGAGVALLDEVKQIARDSGTILENPSIEPSETKDAYLSVPVTVETKSSWDSLVKFLQSLQAPDRFLAIENMEVKVDGADKSKMRGTFRIAKWYAPTGG